MSEHGIHPWNLGVLGAPVACTYTRRELAALKKWSIERG